PKPADVGPAGAAGKADQRALDFSAKVAAGGTARVELGEWPANGPLTVEMYATPRVVLPPNHFRRMWVQGGGGEIAQFGDAWVWQISRPKEGQLDNVALQQGVKA